ncbi:GNAT family N-acetyltransferase [Azospirillum sp. Marseille-Q6669]
MSIHLEFQPFESRFLGGPAYRLSLTPDGNPDRVRLAAEVGRAIADGARLVTARIPAVAAAQAAALEAVGFRVVERLVTLERPLEPVWRMPAGVRLATPTDLSACSAIGRTAFRFDRFHRDARLPEGSADAIKAAWVENGLNGRADAALVAETDGQVSGFVLCLRSGAAAVIDLIAVAGAYRGQGCGRRLGAAALAHYAARGASCMRVGTQADNEASLALYHGLGFRAVSEALTFHWAPGGGR